MKKICLIILYFGKLPDYFPIWLKTCEFNESIDFLLITDDKTKFSYPKNVKVKYMNFKDIQTKFQRIFDFKIILNSPYKLCDYKPAYGEVFSDYLKEYDFWGHCDIDLFFGNIRKFITDDILNKYDRILTRGHFSLYKNEYNFNIKYRTSIVSGCQTYRDVYTTSKSCCYDEWGSHCGNGISEIFKRIGVMQYDEIIYADLLFLKYQFKLAQKNVDTCKNRIFVFNRGNLYEYGIYDGILEKNEYMYCHFQKRNPIINIKNIEDKFCFLPPNKFEKFSEENFDIKKLTRRKSIYMTPFLFRKEQIKKLLGGKL